MLPVFKPAQKSTWMLWSLSQTVPQLVQTFASSLPKGLLRSVLFPFCCDWGLKGTKLKEKKRVFFFSLHFFFFTCPFFHLIIFCLSPSTMYFDRKLSEQGPSSGPVFGQTTVVTCCSDPWAGCPCNNNSSSNSFQTVSSFCPLVVSPTAQDTSALVISASVSWVWTCQIMRAQFASRVGKRSWLRDKLVSCGNYPSDLPSHPKSCGKGMPVSVCGSFLSVQECTSWPETRRVSSFQWHFSYWVDLAELLPLKASPIISFRQ